jgi:FkbM family methyltransferase
VAAGWRTQVVRGVAALPAPVRQRVWQGRRVLARSRRRALEAKGDFSASRPALLDLDAKLAQHLDLDWGFFVEAGANDGFDQSNTYFLERARGWRGVLVEPVPALFEEARRERPSARVFNCALVAEDHPGETVTLRYGGLMTTVAGFRDSAEDDHAWVAAAHEVAQEEPEHEFTVQARTLTSVLDEANAPEIDLLSLDVEGFEPQVLKGLDLSRHAPRFVLVEIRDMATGRAPVEAELGDRYEPVEALTPYDMLYRRR